MILRQLEAEFWQAASEGEEIDVWISRLPGSTTPVGKNTDPLSCEPPGASGGGEVIREFASVDGVEDVVVGAISNAENESGKWRKLKHGITLDSGSNVDITPENENPQFPIVEATGIRKGRCLAAANGTPIPTKGEKWISFSTNVEMAVHCGRSHENFEVSWDDLRWRQ